MELRLVSGVVTGFWLDNRPRALNRLLYPACWLFWM